MATSDSFANIDLGSFYHQDTDDKTAPTADQGMPINPPKSPPPDPFSWRRNPEDSLSGWTIVVISPTTVVKGRAEEGAGASESSKAYHVHKHVIAAGPRGSQYFLQLFKSNQKMQEMKTSTSSIELEASAATAFPAMLDFMYGIHSIEVHASTGTAVALRYLANYFGVSTLFDSVNKFIQRDMNKDNIHIYLQEAIWYQDEKLIDGTMEIGARAWHALLVAKECPLYIEKLPPSKQLQFVKLVGQHAGESLQRSQRQADELLEMTRDEAAQEKAALSQQLKITRSELQRFRPFTSEPKGVYVTSNGAVYAEMGKPKKTRPIYYRLD